MKKVTKFAIGGLVKEPSRISFDSGCIFPFPKQKIYENMRTDLVLEDMLKEYDLLHTRIGIGISTTPNRDILDISLWEKYTPGNFKLVVENDKDYTGVAATKNRLLAQLDDCDHIFLIDDDVVPLSKEWWKPYIESKELHLMYQFKLPGKPSKDMQELYRDNEIVAYSHTRGAVIYLHRAVLDMVGGFDETYGLYGYEHADYTNRIHNAGLTTHRAMDVVGSDTLLYCLDQDNLVESSISKQERRKNILKNAGLYRKSRTSKEFKEYRS